MLKNDNDKHCKSKIPIKEKGLANALDDGVVLSRVLF